MTDVTGRINRWVKLSGNSLRVRIRIGINLNCLYPDGKFDARNPSVRYQSSPDQKGWKIIDTFGGKESNQFPENPKNRSGVPKELPGTGWKLLFAEDPPG
jgi:hypothetical protein